MHQLLETEPAREGNGIQPLLAEHLRIMLPQHSHVECEYRHAGETLDVYVRYNGVFFRDELFIELKRRLFSKAELNRLVGQIMGLNPKKHKLVVVCVRCFIVNGVSTAT